MDKKSYDQERLRLKRNRCLGSSSSKAGAKKDNCEFHFLAKICFSDSQQRLTAVVNFWYLYSNSLNANPFSPFSFPVGGRKKYSQQKLNFSSRRRHELATLPFWEYEEIKGQS